MEKSKKRKLKFFIAHKTDTAHNIATHLKRNLEEQKEVEEAFVAPDDVRSGEEDEEKYRFKKIEEADYFVIILTSRAWENSEPLRKEFNVANGIQKKRFILVVVFKGAKIPEELKHCHWVGGKIFEDKEEVADAFDREIERLYEDRAHESKQKEEKSKLMNESKFVKNIEEKIKELKVYHQSKEEPSETKEEVARELNKTKNFESLKKQKLKFFISYETYTGKYIVVDLKHFLEKLKEVEEVFVASEDIPPGEDEEEYKFNKIREADYFVILLTPGAWENSESLRKEFYIAKNAKKKILPICIKGAEIPKELKNYQMLRQEPFETKEEVARELGKIIGKLYEYFSKQEKEKLKFMSELEFVKNVEEIINKNKRIHFYSPAAPVSCLSEGYMNKVVKLLNDAMEKDKSIFLLFSWSTTIEKIKDMQKTFGENELKNMLLKDTNMLLGKPYLKLIIPFGNILRTPSKDEGVIFGENSNEALIWWKPANKDEIYVKFEDSKEGIDTITELFNKNYNKESSFDIFSESKIDLLDFILLKTKFIKN